METSGTRNSSWLRISRTTGISNLRTRARYGSLVEALMIWLSTGRSTEVSRKLEPSQKWVVPPTVMRFSPCAKTTSSGS